MKKNLIPIILDPAYLKYAVTNPLITAAYNFFCLFSFYSRAGLIKEGLCSKNTVRVFTIASVALSQTEATPSL